jgi:hypothetical protein
LLEFKSCDPASVDDNRRVTRGGVWELVSADSGRVTGNPEVTPKMGSVRIGDDPGKSQIPGPAAFWGSFPDNHAHVALDE